MSEDFESDFVDRLASEVDEYDRAAVGTLCDELVDRLRTTDEPFTADRGHLVMRLLRRKRWFDLMERIGDALIRSGESSPTIKLSHAHSLLEQGRLAAAESAVRLVLSNADHNSKDRAEGQGLLGRIYKQMYIDAGAPTVERNQARLRQSIAAYHVIFAERGERWHGINVVALLDLARREDLRVDGYPEPASIARVILAEIDERTKEGQADIWDCATALEASIAVGDLDSALGWEGKYVASNADSFELSSTLRQLEELWQLRPTGVEGMILDILRSAILAREDGGEVVLTSRLKPADRRPVDDVAMDLDMEMSVGFELKSVLGDIGFQSLRWFRTGLARSEAVVKIRDDKGVSHGSGFLMRGGDLCDALPHDEVFVITNAHVVSTEIEGAAHPDAVEITFEALGSPETFRVVDVMFSSPISQLDVAVLRLDKPAPQVQPIPLAPSVPTAEAKQRVYVIGHPSGGELSFSLQDNIVLDQEDPLLHYRAPTDPGSSGSPVFDGEWRLVALHHKGAHQVLRLNGKPGIYAANEGIWFESIRRAMAKQLETPSP